LPDPHSTVLMVGYQAEGTLGRRLVEGEKDVRIFQEDIHVAAEIVQLNDVSAHADQSGLIHWLMDNPDKPQNIFAVHGEDEVCTEYARILQEEYGYQASAPYTGYIFDLLENKYLQTDEPEMAVSKAETGQEELKQQEKEKEQDIYSQNQYYNELMEQGKKLMRLIEKKKNARNSELKRLLKEVKRITERWD
ncbi:MAG: MBL fold metallo-hydrolase RNA specificity domain-containing protein, partial [Erysipelotrichaceae bacterium]|nr:MBL fold metallo-hydrolase RNA specificity domain-containing protein [Erysipelotrichaceae bacterium]